MAHARRLVAFYMLVCLSAPAWSRRKQEMVALSGLLDERTDSGEGGMGPGAPNWRSDEYRDAICETIHSCFKHRGFFASPERMHAWKAGTPMPRVYMHSGTAANYYGCRANLNDIDLFVEAKYFPIPDAKRSLEEAYPVADEATGYIVGETDKHEAEKPYQAYCPQIDAMKEVDAFQIVNELQGAYNEEFAALNKNLEHYNDKVEPTGTCGNDLDQLVRRCTGFDLFVVSPCDLIRMKKLLMSKRKVPKPSDEQDLQCMLECHEKYGDCTSNEGGAVATNNSVTIHRPT